MNKITLFDVKQRLIALKKEVSVKAFEIGCVLYEVRDKKLFEPEYETFNEFLADPELSFSRITAYKLIKVFDVFVNKFKMLKDVQYIDQDKLYIISNSVTSENCGELIENARLLSRSDLRNIIRKLKGIPELDYSISVPELVKKFLYEVCPKQKIDLDSIEFEELLTIYEKWRSKR